MNIPGTLKKGLMPRNFSSFIIVSYGTEIDREAQHYQVGVIQPLEDVYQKYKNNVDKYFF